MPVVVCTQIYLVKDGLVCLPLKKRGFGQGWHNGYGGKVVSGESLEESARRELKEEALVEAGTINKKAELVFNFVQDGKTILSHVYLCSEFSGTPAETEEMKPFWFNFEQIPYAEMWPDDIVWFPKFLAGEEFRAEFEFLDSKPTIGRHTITQQSFNSK